MYISLFYFILFIISLGALFVLIRSITNKWSNYFVVLFTLISVVCLAYLSYSMAADTGMALVANQFSYIDGTFVQMYFLFCVLQICGINVQKKLSLPLVFGNLFFLLIVFTTARTRLLYKEYEIIYNSGAASLKIDFGPLHTPFLIWVVINTLIPVVAIIYSVVVRKNISYRYILALELLEMAIVSLYFIERMIELHFDILPIGYVLMEIVILSIVRRIALYDGSQIVIDNSVDRREYGYIIFDNNQNYVTSDEVAKYYFPEIKNLVVDRPVKDEFIRTEFVEKLEECSKISACSMVFSRKEHEILATIKPYIPANDGRIHGYIVELRDDTEQQQLIKKLNQVNGELETAVETANSANHAKSDFLASMSHEIRTPINAVLGMNEIALRECKDEAIIPYLNDIKNAGSNLLFIINDILDFSKIEAGKIDIIEGTYSTGKLIKDVKDLIEVKAKEKKLELILAVDDKLPSLLEGDENRIRQIIVNLLNNSVKYTNEGRIEFIVDSLETDENSINLIVSVKDTGIGIKAEDLPTLFDSFSRFDEKKNQGIEGTGLGLAITQRLIKMMNGKVEVDSVYGEGTSFTVTLPQRIVDKTPVGDVNKMAAGESRQQADVHVDASKLNVLVIDDNKLNLKVARGLLKVTGANVDMGDSGRKCLEMIADKHYDIVLLDHMMPEMDGIETLHRAKRLLGGKCAGTVFIALTANAISGVKDMYLDAGFDDYISKPIDPKELEAVIKKVLSETDRNIVTEK